MEIERHGGPLGSFRVQTFFYSNFYCSFVEGDLATMIGFEAAKGVGTVFFKWATLGLFFIYFCHLYKQLTVNNCSIKVANDWIRTRVLWYWKQLRCQLCHNHSPGVGKVILLNILFQSLKSKHNKPHNLINLLEMTFYFGDNRSVWILPHVENTLYFVTNFHA